MRMKPMLTPRREGAKRDISNDRSSVLNLSALASLRETSATQSQEESFTLRREGAKRRNTLNGRIPISNLSGLAPLRETSSKHQRFLGHAIGDTLNAVLDQVFAEVDKEAESLIHQPQIGQDLFAVDRIERCNRFDFHNYAIVDDQIGAETFVEPDSIPCDRNKYLSFDRVALFAQFMGKRDFVYDFEDAGPEPGVQAVSRVNDQSRDFILFHAAKLVLLLLICEAKNVSAAAASLRETFATQSQKDSFSLRRGGAKGQRRHVATFQFQTLASLREISGSKYKRKVRTT
jgi:hypothetical protein